MKIECGCPGCGERYRVSARFAGIRDKCPKCGTLFSVPPLPPKPATRHLLAEVRNDFREATSSLVDALGVGGVEFVRQTWANRGTIALWGGLILWLLTIGCPESMTLWHYGALIIWTSIVAGRLKRRYFPNWAWGRTVAITSVVALVFIYGRWDQFPDQREDEHLTSTVMRYRWSRIPTYKNVWFKDENGKTSEHWEGPLSESGKQHGKWSQFSWSLGGTDAWYWYGEEVSEGQWHALNNGAR